MEEKKLITENDTIFEIVTKYPVVKERLLSISKKFERLNNPVLFNTVARVTTVKKAALVAGIYLNEFLYQLNDAIGLGKEFLESKKREIFTKKEAFIKPDTLKEVEPEWFKKAESFEVVDVREIGEPFFEVTKIAEKKKSGEGFCIIQNFKPLPLIRYLETLGFESYSVFKENAYYVYFYRVK